MKLLGKLISLVIGLTIIGFIGIAVFINFYLTDERIKELVIPQAEKALGRTVAIGDIDVGILSGIKISDFSIKEQDNKSDFVNTESFVVSYDLIPLLQKKFIVSEITLNQPQIKVVRDKDGNFNFNTLAILALPAKAAQEEKTAPSAAKTALPIALTVEKIRIANAILSVVDAKKEVPDTTVKANMSVSLDIGADISQIKYQGEMDMEADAKYGKLQPNVKMTAQFDNSSVDYKVDMEMEKEELTIEGKVTNFTAPDILVNASSQKLNLDKLLALLSTLPVKESDQKNVPKSKKGKAEAIAKSFPPGLHVHGLVSIKQTLYNKLEISDFKISHDLTKGVLTIKDLSANTAGGQLISSMKVDLNKVDPAYNGSINANSIDVEKLGTGLEKGFADILSGSMQSQINFEGAGFDPEVIKKALSADASYSLNNGQIKSTEVTRSIASVTGVKELDDIKFKDINGTLKLIKGGIIELKSTLNSKDIGAETSGTTDLDGNLNLPIMVKLSKELSQKLDKGASITKYLANEKGETVLNLKVAGTVDKPKTSLDTSGAQEQVKETVKAKAMEELGRVLKKQQGETGTTDSNQGDANVEQGLNVLKGLFGQ